MVILAYIFYEGFCCKRGYAARTREAQDGMSVSDRRMRDTRCEMLFMRHALSDDFVTTRTIRAGTQSGGRYLSLREYRHS